MRFVRFRLVVPRVAIAAVTLLALVIAGDGAACAGSSVEPLGASSPLVFRRGTLNASITQPTSLAFGPDGRLYAAFRTGIQALTLHPATYDVLATEQIASGLDTILGIAFDPTAPPSPVVFYVSRQNAAATNGYEGVVSTFTRAAPGWTRTDVITGLPSSQPHSNHYTNGLAFDEAGTLYIAQGSNTDAGLAGPNWPETPLSAAILTADVTDPAFNGTITYSPPGPPADDNVNQIGDDVSVFAAGTRNPYDLVVHSNGYVYATDNAPSGPDASLTCSTSASGVSFHDELNLIETGNYYGHPNRNRGRFDARQCTYHPPEGGSGVGFTGPIAMLPEHCSCDGIAEYTASAFGGALQGDLLFAEYIGGRVTRAELSADGRSVVSLSSLATGFSGSLDVAMGPDGTIFVAELNADRISYLAPDSDRDGCFDGRELSNSQLLGGRRDPNHFWDFFDTPGPANARDQAVNVSDLLRLVLRFGATGSPAIDPLSAPPTNGYHPAFDRTAAVPPAERWDLGPADGSINVVDIASMVAQFGHTCVLG